MMDRENEIRVRQVEQDGQGAKKGQWVVELYAEQIGAFQRNWEFYHDTIFNTKEEAQEYADKRWENMQLTSWLFGDNTYEVEIESKYKYKNSTPWSNG